MPRKFTSTEIDYATRSYAAGKTFKQIATSLGRDPEAVRLALKRRGVKARPGHSYVVGHNRIAAPDDLVASYDRGESVLAMSHRYGVSRAVVNRWMKEAGLARRTASEANSIRLSSMTGEQRRALVAAANEAARGRIVPDEVQERIAATRERIEYGGRPSSGVEALRPMLDGESIEYTLEKAVGRYNVDIALPRSDIAVEVLGGNWHGAKPIHARRTPDILNRGWHILFVWNTKRCQIGTGALDQIVAFVKFASENPAARREYRVIRGDGKLTAVGHADDNEFPLVPPSEANLH